MLFGASITLGRRIRGDPAPVSGRVVIVGGYGSSWAAVDRAGTPTLFGTAALGGVASLSPRTATATSCVPDAWLTISAGRRSTADCAPAAVTTADDGSATVTGWDGLVARQRDLGYDATPGLLGDAVKASGRIVCAVGPEAAAGAADAGGQGAGLLADASRPAAVRLRRHADHGRVTSSRAPPSSTRCSRATTPPPTCTWPALPRGPPRPARTDHGCRCWSTTGTARGSPPPRAG